MAVKMNKNTCRLLMLGLASYGCRCFFSNSEVAFVAATGIRTSRRCPTIGLAASAAVAPSPPSPVDVLSPLSAKEINGLTVRDADGDFRLISELSGNEEGVPIVFLRHMASIFSWSSAAQWSDVAVLDRLRKMGFAEPVFIVPGQPEQISSFLEANPHIPSNRVFVDDTPGKEVYRQMGFGRLDEPWTLRLPTPPVQNLTYFTGKMGEAQDQISHYAGVGVAALQDVREKFDPSNPTQTMEDILSMSPVKLDPSNPTQTLDDILSLSPVKLNASNPTQALGDILSSSPVKPKLDSLRAAGKGVLGGLNPVKYASDPLKAVDDVKNVLALNPVQFDASDPTKALDNVMVLGGVVVIRHPNVAFYGREELPGLVLSPNEVLDKVEDPVEERTN